MSIDEEGHKEIAAYVGLGSNLGDCQAMLEKAVQELRAEDGLQVSKVSSWYWTEAVGGPADQPRYLNGVAKVVTSLGADELLSRLMLIEKRLGRKRQQRRGPRCIDLDLLLYGQEIIKKEEQLEVPHRLMHKREFVLRGLAEIAPRVIHPVLGMTAEQMWQKIRSAKQDSKK
ncbi:MAG: 2-amino-4-hydroxy-6-hydroxymethyldihydropteridine diphosphokinase [Phycisphaerae bacterium]|nr:2-amino-4-hydroxy-6-hydroxymethyldihydropteridine diphosphokinase [Phycisphaerae bacterium]